MLDNIIVGYAFGPKKMETMGLIMAEASKALSTVVTPAIEYPEESSMVTNTGESLDHYNIGEKEPAFYFPDDCDDEDARSFSSTRASSIASHRSLRGCGGLTGIQLTFLPDTSGLIPWVRSASRGAMADGDQSIAELSMATAATTTATGTSSFHSTPAAKRKSLDGTCANLPSPSSQASLRHSISTTGNGMRRHPIRVSFVPIDLDTPLEEQHGGKFDVILHKMTEDILCISKMLRSRQQEAGYEGIKCEGNRMDEAIELLGASPLHTQSCDDNDHAIPEHDIHPVQTNMLSRHQERAAQRIQRLRKYKEQAHPSCVLVDSPTNILAVMSRADMAEVLSSCLEGVTTKGGTPVSTPRFRVVEEGEESKVPCLANEMDANGFTYPLIAKPLTAAGTKSSHHMGIVMARDGLQRLKTPCLLQEYANHGGTLFKVYVLGESVWVFSRESLPNLPHGENEIPSEKVSEEKRPAKSYVEFQRLAGSRCYVEFNSQRPYPTLSDFGIDADTTSSVRMDPTNEQWEPESKKPRLYNALKLDDSSSPAHEPTSCNHKPDLASYVTKEEIEPVTNTLRAAFGLDLFGFDVLVKHEQTKPQPGDIIGSEVKEIFVVDVNYFPGYKEVPHFPSLLAQYLTQKAVESRMNVR
jgi:inositol-1,3,4-trisphosphate 5/6-kinase/inositol-tetrakisphosphate 1-kinase